MYLYIKNVYIDVDIYRYYNLSCGMNMNLMGFDVKMVGNAITNQQYAMNPIPGL